MYCRNCGSFYEDDANYCYKCGIRLSNENIHALKCDLLKNIRGQVARLNDIPLEVRECPNRDSCGGICPACDAEGMYLNKELAGKKNVLWPEVEIE